MLSTRTPCGRFLTSIGTRPLNAGPRSTARLMETCWPGWISTRRGRAATLRLGSRRDRDPSPGRAAGVDLLRIGRGLP